MFVQRNEQGVVTGVFAARQDGFAEEWLPADHPEVLAYLAEVAQRRAGG